MEREKNKFVSNLSKFTNSPKGVFCCGFFIGIITFLFIYGFNVLNFTNINWIMNGDNDLKQHFLGWCFYRRTPWQFPIGLIEGLSYPYKMSMMYTDSIPLFAILFKIIDSIFHLPKVFQYFGLYGLLCFTLQGGISSLIVSKLSKNNLIGILSSIFFTTTTLLLRREFYHTALCAQWVILLALYLWLCKEKKKEDKWSILSYILTWSLMGILAALTHPYFLPMVGGILVIDIIDKSIFYFIYFKKEMGNKEYIKYILQLFVSIIFYCFSALFTLTLLGAFYQKTDRNMWGIDVCSSNFNTLFNPPSDDYLLLKFDNWDYFQYEGSGYLGLGMIVLFIIAIIQLIYLFGKKSSSKIDVKKLFIENYRKVLIIFCCLVFFFLATFPTISFYTKGFYINLGDGIIERLYETFRAHGRFIWIVVYLIYISTISFVSRHNFKYIGFSLITIALCLQLQDASIEFKQRNESYFSQKDYTNIWDDIDAPAIIGTNDIIFFEDNPSIMMETALYVYLHDMQMNTYYYARGIWSKIKDNISIYGEDLLNGNIYDKTTYIFPKNDDWYNLYEPYLIDNDINYIEFGDFYVFSNK